MGYNLSGKIDLDNSQARSAVNQVGGDLQNVDQQLRNVERQISRQISSWRKAQYETKKAVKEQTAVLKQLGGSIAGVGINLAQFATKLGIATAALKLLEEAVKYNVRTAAEFEQSIANLSAITGNNGKDLEYFKEQAIEMGRTTTQTASQVAEAFTIMAQKSPQLLGAKTALVEVTKQAIILAQASGVTVQESTDAISSVMNQFELSALEVIQVTDQFASSQRNSAASIAYLSEALSQCGTAAHTFGLDTKTTIGALGELAQAGLKAGQAGRQLKNILINMETKAPFEEAKPSVVGFTQALENLRDSGIEADTKALKKMFGQENIQGALYLIKHVESLKTMIEKVGDSAGMAMEQSDIRTNTFKGSVTKLKSAWEGLNLAINESNGLLQTMADLCTKVINGTTSILNNKYKRLKYEDVGRVLRLGEDVQWGPGLTDKDNAQLEKFKKQWAEANSPEEQQKVVDKWEKFAANEAKIFKERFEEKKKRLIADAELAKKSLKKDAWYAQAEMTINKKLNEDLGRLVEERDSKLNLFNAIHDLNNKPELINQTANEPTVIEPKTPNNKPNKTKVKTTAEKYDEIIAENKKLIASLEERTKADTDGVISVEENAKELAKIYTDTYNKLKGLDWKELLKKRKDAFGVFTEIASFKKAADQDVKTFDDMKKQLEKNKKDEERILQEKKKNWQKYWNDFQKEKDKNAFFAANGFDSGTKFDKKLKEIKVKLKVDENTDLFDKETISNLSANYDNMDLFGQLADLARERMGEIQEELFDLSQMENLGSSIDNGQVEGLDEIRDKIEELKAKYKELSDAVEKYNKKQQTVSDKQLDLGKVVKNAGALGEAFTQAGSAIGQFAEDSEAAKAASIALTVLGTIASLIAQFAQKMATTTTIWEWIAAGISGVATLISMTASLRSMSNQYSSGGIVGGGSYVGDKQISFLNSGEMVLNQGQQNRLFKMINGELGTPAQNNNSINSQVEFVIRGQDLVGTLTNYQKRTSRI